jgi:hypothetical protein
MQFRRTHLHRRAFGTLKMFIYPARTIRFLMVASLLLVIAPRLPAPIQEISPTPTPSRKAKESRAPSPERSTQSKKERLAESKPSTNRRPSPTPLPRLTKKFAGTWSGTVNVPNPVAGGNTTCTYLFNDAENSVQENCEGFNANTSRAIVSGNSISWKNGMFKEYANTLIVSGDGRVGQVTITSSWGKGSGTVRRIMP